MLRTIKHDGVNTHVIIMLHGTGGSADSLFNLGNYIDPKATLVGVEGDVMENGMRRYFERYPDGSFKLKSLAEATQKLYRTIQDIIKDHPNKTISMMGYSNGANIALNLMKEYENMEIKHAILFHPSPVRSDVPFKSQTTKVLITSGSQDPFITQEQFENLKQSLTKSLHVESYTHDFGHELIQEELDVTKTFLEEQYE